MPNLKPKMISLRDFKKSPIANALLLKPHGQVIKASQDPKDPIRYVISDESVDRDDDTIAVAGWDLTRYNGVVLFGHQSWMPSVGKSRVFVDGKKLMADCEYASREVYEFAGMVGDLVRGGFMPSASVGFKPSEWEVANERMEDDEDSWSRPYNFLRQELLEWSSVPVPSNTNANVQLEHVIGNAKSAGIDVMPMLAWAEQVLGREKGAGSWIKRGDLEAVALLLKPTTHIDLAAGGVTAARIAKEGAVKTTPKKPADIVVTVTPVGTTPAKDGDDGEDDTASAIAQHVKAMSDLHQSVAKMVADHSAAFEALHTKCMDLHRQASEILSKASAVLIGKDDDDEGEAAAPAGTTKDAGSHVLSGAQYKRVKAIKKSASMIMAAHHAADGDSDEEEEEGNASSADDGKALGTALEESFRSVTDVQVNGVEDPAGLADLISKAFAEQGQQLEHVLEEAVATAKQTLTGKAV